MKQTTQNKLVVLIIAAIIIAAATFAYTVLGDEKESHPRILVTIMTTEKMRKDKDANKFSVMYQCNKQEAMKHLLRDGVFTKDDFRLTEYYIEEKGDTPIDTENPRFIVTTLKEQKEHGITVSVMFHGNKKETWKFIHKDGLPTRNDFTLIEYFIDKK